MYPGPTNSPMNHPRAVCSDEVWQSARVEKTTPQGKVVVALEAPPPFPQPERLFSADKDGHRFHADRLFKLLRDFYMRIIAGVAGSGPNAMYDIAFAGLLQNRIKLLDATATSPMIVLFRPYLNVKIEGVNEAQMFSYCSEDWIRLDDLSGGADIFTNIAPPPSQPPGMSRSQFSGAGFSSQPGASRAGSLQPGVSRVGSSQPGASRAGSSQPGASRAGLSRGGISRICM